MAMVLDLVAFKPPTVSVLPKTANIVVPGHVRVYVVDPKNGTQLAFILGTVSLFCFVSYTDKKWVVTVAQNVLLHVYWNMSVN